MTVKLVIVKKLLLLSFLGGALLFLGCDGAQDPSSQTTPPQDFSPTPSPEDASPPDVASPDAPVASPGPLRVATWNVERFFDLSCDTGQCRRDDYEELPTESFFSMRAQQIARGIERMDADVVLLQEVESEASLEAIQQYLPEPYEVAYLGEIGTPASVDVAVLSRGTLTDAKGYRRTALRRPDGSATRFAREFLQVNVDIEGRKAIFFVAHFKSKSNDDPGRRLAEAQAAAEIITQTAAENPDALIVFGGDLNDTPGSEPIEALESQPGMLRVAQELTPEDWTYTYIGRGQAIDHLFLMSGRVGRAIPGSVEVFRSTSSYGYSGSDHCALLAQFDWRTF